MLYTIYEIRNKIDGKVYVGKHQTTDLDDGYLGSGKVLTRAIKKHGRENFEKRILHVFETEAEMNDKEAELVTEEFCSRDDTYNLGPGGEGGPQFLGKTHTLETKKKISFANKGRKLTKEQKLKIAKKAHVGAKASAAKQKGKPKRDSHKESISASLKEYWKNVRLGLGREGTASHKG